MNIGDYVRTGRGQIYKLTKENEGTQKTICIKNISILKEFDTIKKSSKRKKWLQKYMPQPIERQ